MHKLNLYLNEDQYEQLRKLSDEADYDSPEECANELFYTHLHCRWIDEHPEVVRKLWSDQITASGADMQTLSCPLCGKEMTYIETEEGSHRYECPACEIVSRIRPDGAMPDDCYAEFSKSPLYVEARRRWGMDRPGINITAYLYTGVDVVAHNILSADQENVSFEEIQMAAAEAFLALLPFAEKFSTEAVEAALKEYIQELSSSH